MRDPGEVHEPYLSFLISSFASVKADVAGRGSARLHKGGDKAHLRSEYSDQSVGAERFHQVFKIRKEPIGFG
jgi:hypothetical protein